MGPNIVFVVLDAVRYDHLSANGYDRDTTPFLTELASQGQRYTHCFASSPWTVPSHASLFTGKHVYEHGVYGRHLKLAPGIPTLAEEMQTSGYETVMVTANNLICGPTGLARGFDRVLGFRGLAESGPLSRFRLANRAVTKLRLERYKDFGARWVNEQVRKWARTRSRSQPFLLFINYLDAHLPYRPQARYRDMFLPASLGARAASIEQDPLLYAIGQSELSRDDLRILGMLYDAEVRYLDDTLRGLYATFREAGLNRNAIWILTSDHGENLGDHGQMDHQFSVADTLIRVPLILHVPDCPLPGAVVSHLVQHKDLHSWILAALDAPLCVTAHRSLSERDYCLSEYLGAPLAEFDELPAGLEASVGKRLSRCFRAIHTERHKLVEVDGDSHELYDTLEDPAEESDIAATYPEVVEGLRALLQQHPLESKTVVSVDKDDESVLREQLRALGYID